ncbi:MAG: electron transfer flavoprotein subunit beta/FixA family protein [Bacteroidales bacterium]|nr:electron transfer flavoprotein subunit beta/FixA family protein [Bacteroidales bacterium]
MSLKIVVLAKQVPDTRNVGPDAMTPEGTVNRSALPAIFNPEDLNALEQALRLKDQFPGSTITVVTMGLPKAADILRDALYRGADDAVLLTDRALGGADTLATSYAISQAIRKIGVPDIIIGGRQAIDGDTAQVGPQVAQKLDLDQVTYVESIDNLCEECRKVTVTRRIDGGVEKVEAPLPVLLTITGSAPACRPQNAKRVMKYKKAAAPCEGREDAKYTITQWGAADIDADLQQCGLAGSPTKVKAVQNIVFKAKESKQLTAADNEIESLIQELLASHTIG